MNIFCRLLINFAITANLAVGFSFVLFRFLDFFECSTQFSNRFGVACDSLGFNICNSCYRVVLCRRTDWLNVRKQLVKELTLNLEGLKTLWRRQNMRGKNSDRLENTYFINFYQSERFTEIISKLRKINCFKCTVCLFWLEKSSKQESNLLISCNLRADSQWIQHAPHAYSI